MSINKDGSLRKSGDMQNFTNNNENTMTSFFFVEKKSNASSVCLISYSDITFRYIGDDMKKTANVSSKPHRCILQYPMNIF